VTHSGDQADIVVSFDVPANSDGTIVMLWAGHLAIGTSGWGTGLGAASISGAPFHMRTQQLDDSGNKNQDRSIQPAAIILPPSLTINKTADHSTVNAGEPIGYVVTLHNSGAGDATGVTLSDALPAGTGINWSLSATGTSIPAGIACAVGGSPPTETLSCGTDPATTGTFTLAAGATITLHVTSPTTAASCGTLRNSASAHSDNDGSPTVGPIDITINCPNVTIAKTPDSATATGGDTIGFTVTLSNTGAGDATGVTLSDPLPGGGGLNWSLVGTGTSIPSGIACAVSGTAPTQSLSCGTDPANTGTFTLPAGTTITLHVTSPTTAAECGSTVTNTATVTVGNGTGGSATASIDVTCPILSIHLAKDGPDLAHVGDTIHYTLTVTNGTDEPLFDITVTDPICNSAPVYQSGDTNDDQILQSGESWIYTCDHVVTLSDPDPLPNTAHVTAVDKLGRPTEAFASHTVDIIHPSISIVKTANPISGAPGDTVTYTYVVKNTGDTTLFNITVVDDKIVPSTIGTIAQLAPGQSVTLTKTTTLPGTAGALTNVGTASGTDVLGKTVSAHDNATVTVVLAVIIAKTGSNGFSTGLVGFLFIAVGVAMATRKERGRVRPAFATSSSVAGRGVMLAANRRSWRMRRRRGPTTRARLRWRRSQGPPMRDGP
jgi:uncharacterized repeat protein (TIGR01451 family)